jgi:hypothetical protein
MNKAALLLKSDIQNLKQKRYYFSRTTTIKSKTLHELVTSNGADAAIVKSITDWCFHEISRTLFWCKIKPKTLIGLKLNCYNTNATTTKFTTLLVFVLIIKKSKRSHERSRLIIIQEIYRKERQSRTNLI